MLSKTFCDAIVRIETTSFFHFVISSFFILPPLSFSLSFSSPLSLSLPLFLLFSNFYYYRSFSFFFFSFYIRRYVPIFFSSFFKTFFIPFYVYLSFLSFHLFRFMTVVQYSSRSSLGSPLVSRWLPVTPPLKHCSGILATRALKDG